jgi:curved DNA-binding protein CbpA
MPAARDPYETLGVRASATDAELRAAYHRLVQLHHPDHNAGSAESERRFEEIQEAYARVRALRERPGGSPGQTGSVTGAAFRAGQTGSSRGAASRAGQTGSTGAAASRAGRAAAETDPAVEARLAEMERELRAARDAREQAIRDARAAQEQALRDAREAGRQTMRDMRRAGSAQRPERPSDEELGYYSTDDSFSKILTDFASELSGHLSEARESPAAHRISDLIDELGSKLTGQRHDSSDRGERPGPDG